MGINLHLFLGLFLISISLFTHANTPSPTAVMVAPVTKEQVSNPIEALGTLRANESVDITVHLAEVISHIYFTEGQRVNKGDLLLELQSSEEQAALQEAKYTLEEANSQLRRIKAIAKQGDASQSLLDERQREYNVAKARLHAIQSKLKDHKVTAPFSGLVGIRRVSPGAFVAPGEVITTLIDDSIMKLDFNVPAVYLADLKIGMPIKATTAAFRHQTFTGVVAVIDNHVDPISRSVTVRALIPNTHRLLKPGLMMEVTLFSAPREALIIPEEALIPKADQQFVFVVNPSTIPPTAEKQPVSIGKRWPGKVEILEGVKEQQQVIIHGADKVRPNSPIKILKTISAAAQGDS